MNFSCGYKIPYFFLGVTYVSNRSGLMESFETKSIYIAKKALFLVTESDLGNYHILEVFNVYSNILEKNKVVYKTLTFTEPVHGVDVVDGWKSTGHFHGDKEREMRIFK